jgi:hypothetical protein
MCAIETRFMQFDGLGLKAISDLNLCFGNLKEFAKTKKHFYKEKYLIVNHCHCAAFFCKLFGTKEKENWRKIIYHH